MRLGIGATSTAQVPPRAYKSCPTYATHDADRPYNVWSYREGRVVGQYPTMAEARAAAHEQDSRERSNAV